MTKTCTSYLSQKKQSIGRTHLHQNGNDCTQSFAKCCPAFNMFLDTIYVTHWGRVTHICISNINTIGSDNGLSACWCHAIIWTNAGTLLIGPCGTKFSEILIESHIFSYKKIHFKMSSGKWWLFCLGLNVLKNITLNRAHLIWKTMRQQFTAVFLMYNSIFYT